jgi:dUTPase
MEHPIFKFAIREDLIDTGDLFLPTKGEPFASGWDVRAAQKDRKDMVIKPGMYFKIPLGFRCIPEEGWWYYLNPRSSSFVKKHIHSLIGIVDEHFFLEACWCSQYLSDSSDLKQEDIVIRFGDAIGQIIPIKRQEMIVQGCSNKELEQLHSARKGVVRDGGFGSTSK